MSRPGLSYEPPLFAWNLGSVLLELCTRSGIRYDRFQADIIEGSVEGFSTNSAQTVSAAIEALQAIYMFDIANYDGQLNFIPRGGPIVATIQESDMVDAGGSISELTRDDPINTPRVMHLKYLDTDGGLTADMQKSDRALDERGSAESNMETTVIMRADDAARAITIMHKVKAEDQRGTRKFELPIKWIRLAVSDPINIGAERFRIDKISMDELTQKYEAIYDRRTAYESSIKGVPITPPTTPPNLLPSETVFHVLDIPLIDSADDSLGHYVATASVTNDWGGAYIDLSRDGGQNWIDSESTNANVIMGGLISPLAAHNQNYPDRHNKVQVSLLRDDMSLTPATFTEMYNRINLALIGDELVYFSNAVEVDDNIWELSGFLRGRKGTESIAHIAGERFVLLPSGVIDYVSAEPYDRNKVLTYKYGSIGSEQADIISTTFTGKSQIERAPAYLKARRVGADLVITWRGIGKLGGGQNIMMGAYFAGYRVELNGQTWDTTAMTLTIPYAAGTLSVSQVNSLTGPGPAATVSV